MIYRQPLLSAIFVNRNNRFSASVEIDGQPVEVHVPNSGRIKELLIKGNQVYIAPAATGNPTRKTSYTLTLAMAGEHPVCIHSVSANDLFEEAVRENIVTQFSGYTIAAREKTVGQSRMDFVLLDADKHEVFTEIKSVSLVEGKRALFPDAPTERGSKHLRELIKLKGENRQSAVVFIIQREDADSFSPYDLQDPVFGKTLREADKAGVNILAYKCRVSVEEIKVLAEVPVIL